MGKKRPNGDGSYYRVEARNLWYFEGVIAGKRQKCSGRTQKDARERWEALKVTVEAAPPAPRSEETVAEWLEYWFGVASPNLRPSTRVGYRSMIDRHIVPAIGHLKLADVRPPHLQSLQTALLEIRAASSVNQVRTILRQAFDLACRHEVLASNPMLAVKGPRKADPDSDFLTVDEARAVIKAATDPRDRARFLLALVLGLRQGEVLGLHWNDLQLDTPVPTLSVAGTLHFRPRVGLVYEATKTKHSRRTLELPPEVAEALRAWRAIHNALKLGSGRSDFNADGYLFTTPVGSPIDPSNDRKNWKKTLKKAQVRPVKLHAARHTAASLMLGQGAGLEVVRDILGHTTIRTTADVYGHLTKDVGGRATSALARALIA